MSCDWETVKNVVPVNSSMKPDQTGGDGKGVKQSEMFNYSVYSRLVNNKQWCSRVVFCMPNNTSSCIFAYLGIKQAKQSSQKHLRTKVTPLV